MFIFSMGATTGQVSRIMCPPASRMFATVSFSACFNTALDVKSHSLMGWFTVLPFNLLEICFNRSPERCGQPMAMRSGCSMLLFCSLQNVWKSCFEMVSVSRSCTSFFERCCASGVVPATWKRAIAPDVAKPPPSAFNSLLSGGVGNEKNGLSFFSSCSPRYRPSRLYSVGESRVTFA